jgi:hypothetical protein
MFLITLNLPARNGFRTTDNATPGRAVHPHTGIFGAARDAGKVGRLGVGSLAESVFDGKATWPRSLLQNQVAEFE